MQISCPTCNASIEQNSPPLRGPTNDGSDAWVCLKCPAVVCVWCYHVHTADKHPEAYRKKPTVGGKKNQRRGK